MLLKKWCLYDPAAKPGGHFLLNKRGRFVEEGIYLKRVELFNGFLYL